MSVERLAAALSDRYRIERELGQGGMATVYLAQDLRHDRQVASCSSWLRFLFSLCSPCDSVVNSLLSVLCG